MTPTKTAVIGTGGWGTALSVIWSQQGRQISLWGKDPHRIEQLRQTRENSAYLPGVKITDAVGLTSDLKVCAEAELIVFVTRSTALRETAAQVKKIGVKADAVLL